MCLFHTVGFWVLVLGIFYFNRNRIKTVINKVKKFFGLVKEDFNDIKNEDKK